mmetsp:Transcript_68340/g.152532  ORF Transcript_68340/g.152532 Transcript_68340/m.152532 type:complete len:263 (-) Transcript_68340:421-1209(-)
MALVLARLESTAVPAEAAAAVKAEVVMAPAILSYALAALRARLSRPTLQLLAHQLEELRVCLVVGLTPAFVLCRCLLIRPDLGHEFRARHPVVRRTHTSLARIAGKAVAPLALWAAKGSRVVGLRPDEYVVARGCRAPPRLPAAYERFQLALICNLFVLLPQLVPPAPPRRRVYVANGQWRGTALHRTTQRLGADFTLAHPGSHVSLQAFGAEDAPAALQPAAGQLWQRIKADWAFKRWSKLGGVSCRLRLLISRGDLSCNL